MAGKVCMRFGFMRNRFTSLLMHCMHIDICALLQLYKHVFAQEGYEKSNMRPWCTLACTNSVVIRSMVHAEVEQAADRQRVSHVC